MSTIILTQAAAESWVFSAYRRATVQPGKDGGWVRRWLDAPAMICGEGTRALDTSSETWLGTLSRWRNFLLHGDDRARGRLHEIVPEHEVADRLTCGFAREVVDNMDAAFTDAGALLGAHGTPGLHSSMLWVAPDEA